jgi:hypothetical protein
VLKYVGETALSARAHTVARRKSPIAPNKLRTATTVTPRGVFPTQPPPKANINMHKIKPYPFFLMFSNFNCFYFLYAMGRAIISVTLIREMQEMNVQMSIVGE